MNSVAHRSPGLLREDRVARWLLTALTLATGLGGVVLFHSVLAERGINLAEWLLLPLFGVLFTWIAFSFCTATFGLVMLLRGRRVVSSTETDEPFTPGRPSRVAVLMPVYNESPVRVFAGLEAMIRSLERTGHAAVFDFFVLSDTTDPDVWLEEERMWGRVVGERGDDRPRVFYRRRVKNVARKSGNLEEFLTRWGSHYEHMIVLDADSVMDGATLVEMVRRMDADSGLGLLQVPPTPVGRMSAFARLQQFSAQMYGPVFVRGFAGWAQHDGNYWGHNAIIRVAPFMEHCGLPKLPGVAPLGGEILSHDFVEAALLARAGWRVALAHDLGGSYEECPTTLLDFAKRDQRWCQGNMQHIRLVFCENIRPVSRLHLASGVMSFLSSPLWMAFLALSLVGMILDHEPGAASPWSARGAAIVFGATMALLLLPKVWGLIALVRDPFRRRRQGGWLGSVGSVLLETFVSVLIAPLMMLYHSRFVITTLLGRSVQWNAQNRDDDGTSFGDAFREHWPHTALGVGAAAALWVFAPSLLPWFSPILAGLVLSIPLAMFLGSSAVGRTLRDRGLLLVPEETRTPEVLRVHQRAITANAEFAAEIQREHLFEAVLHDPVFHTLHRNILDATGMASAIEPDRAESLAEAIERDGAAAISRDDRKALLSDPDALWEVHLRLRSRGTSARRSRRTAV